MALTAVKQDGSVYNKTLSENFRLKGRRMPYTSEKLLNIQTRDDGVGQLAAHMSQPCWDLAWDRALFGVLAGTWC